MANTILMTHEAIELEGTVISGGTAASSSMALENVLTVQPSEFARFVSDVAATTYFIINTALGAVGGERSIAVFVGYSNVSARATIRLRVASSEANTTASPLYDTGVVNFWHDTSVGPFTTTTYVKPFPRGGHHLFVIDAADADVDMRWWRIDIDDEGENTDGWVQVGVINIGEVFAATNPINNGWSFGAAPIWVGQTAMGGQKYRRSVAAPGVVEATWQMTSQAEANRLHNIVRNNAESKAMLCVIDADDDTGIMNNLAWGHMTATQPIAVPHYGLWQTTIRVEEMP